MICIQNIHNLYVMLLTVKNKIFVSYRWIYIYRLSLGYIKLRVFNGSYSRGKFEKGRRPEAIISDYVPPNVHILQILVVVL